MTQRKSHPCAAFGVCGFCFLVASCVYGTRHVDGWCILGLGPNCSLLLQYSGCGSKRLDTSLSAVPRFRQMQVDGGDDAVSPPSRASTPSPCRPTTSVARSGSTGQSLPLYGYNSLIKTPTAPRVMCPSRPTKPGPGDELMCAAGAVSTSTCAPPSTATGNSPAARRCHHPGGCPLRRC